ncbi:exosortase [Bradyrhizobium sp. dw_78]|uniref:exosortase n=1 Tax=Bradyrhizobium sp. dw_78 TaxID=2719793 RepID=UPI001BD3AA5B|nr:exosortase [Bradyrhizobium sp. dw_78]
MVPVMSYSEALITTKSQATRSLLWPALLAASVIVAYIPTFITLAQGPWQTEQEGHGPLIIAAAVWLVWQSRDKLRKATLSPSPLPGWLALIGGLIVLVLSRNQDIWFTEVASEIPVLAGCILILAGWQVLRIVAFPIGFLIFSAPAPGWMVDGATVPLKVLISDLVTNGLYALGYPIAQNGVVIEIGPYQLLVQDACSGLNSIFALSAIGVFYVYAFRWHEKIRGLILLALIVPITITANFLRVVALVLIAYYGGVEKIEGVLHDMTGIALFIVAVLLMFACDGLISLIGNFIVRTRRSRPNSAAMTST